MKKLVKKIALPGAILAFAMALFGGATYAYSTLTTWDETGRTHLVEVHKNLRKLAKSVNDLKGQKVLSETKIEELNTSIENLKSQLQNAQIQIENAPAEQQKAIEEAVKDYKSQLEESMGNLDKAQKDNIKLTADYKEAQQQITELKQQQKVSDNEISELEDAINNARELKHQSDYIVNEALKD